MKNLIIKGLCVMALAFTVVSCGDDFLDINQDPLAATEANADLLLPEVLVNLSSNRTVELNAINIQTQHWSSGGSAGVFSGPERYTISIFTTGNTWSNYYTTGLKNLFLAIQDAQSQDPPANNVVAQSKILEAFIYYNLTSIWEKVPFSQAVNPDFPIPEFDEQEVILNGAISRIDEALALLDDGDTRRATTGDMLFGGDLDKWRKFGNSLKFKIWMMIANRNPGAAGPALQALSGGDLITSAADEAAFQFSTNVGNENPIWKVIDRFSGQENRWWYANTTCLGIMQDLSDPRVSTYYTEGDLDPPGQYDGIEPGVTSGAAAAGSRDFAYVSLNIIRPDYPDRYITASEMSLLLAEAAARGWISGGMAQADAYYRQGVQASLDWFDGQPGEIDMDAKTTYVSSLADLISLSETDALEAIQTQQYIDIFGRTTDAWSLWKRTHFPVLPLPEGANNATEIIRRYPYPPDEKGANPNVPTEPDIDLPMWYEN